MNRDAPAKPVELTYAAPPNGRAPHRRSARLALWVAGFVSPLGLLVAVEVLLYPRFRTGPDAVGSQLGVGLALLTCAFLLPLVLMGLGLLRDYAAGWMAGMIAMVILGPIAIIGLGWLNLRI